MTQHPHRRDERGMVTAELATVAPFGLALALLLVWCVGLGITQVRLVDASREAARMVARGEPVDRAVEVAQRQAPDGARVEVTTEDGLVTVTVAAAAGLDLPGLASIGQRDLRARSVAAAEAP